MSLEIKVCPKCEQLKLLSEFCNDKSRIDGKHCYCKNCTKELAKNYYSKNKIKKIQAAKIWKTANKEKVLAKQKAFRQLNPKKYKSHALKAAFNITIEDYDRMFIEQNGCCAICSRHQNEFKKAFAVDHNHETGNIRGLLCQTCNIGIGNLQDSEEIIAKALLYIKKYSK